MILKSNLSRVRGILDVYIYPGSNHIPDSKSVKLMEHPDFQLHYKIGDFSIVDTDSGVKKTHVTNDETTEDSGDNGVESIVEEISQMNARKAIEVIKDIYLIDALKAIAGGDGRKSVTAAAEAQIEELTSNPDEE
jgi:hypothetical protein